MTNKQDEGMTISRAKEIIAECVEDNRQHSVEYWESKGFIEGWNAAVRECADEIREPCLYYPIPCGDCRHCFATKTAIRILKLQSEGEK